ncbi:hypothetical protein [Demequina sp. NBRC 110054]|uniref:hypothetical protein n=1 Tax=Demequina sp. NBRC 110054 TaxID=1570343 RepID=UPI000A0383D5|nr:hypothetical protein [Demequina sp. NBRC 110054]
MIASWSRRWVGIDTRAQASAIAPAWRSAARWFVLMALGCLVVLGIGLDDGRGKLYVQGLLLGFLGFPLLTGFAISFAARSRVVSGRAPQVLVYLGNRFVVFLQWVFVVPRVHVLRTDGPHAVSVERPLAVGEPHWTIRLGEKARLRGTIGSDAVSAEERRNFDADIERINDWLRPGVEAEIAP